MISVPVSRRATRLADEAGSVPGISTAARTCGRQVHGAWPIVMTTGLLLAGVLSAHAFCPGAIQWQGVYGGDRIAFPRALQPDGEDGYVLAGDLSTPGLESGSQSEYTRLGSYDYWLVRLGPGGESIQEFAYGGTGRDSVQALVPTADGGWLLAGTSESDAGGSKAAPQYGEGDFWVVRVDAAGRKLWEQSWGGTNFESLNAAAVMPDGRFLLAGRSDTLPSGNKVTTGHGSNDMWVVCLNAQGTILWDHSYGGDDLDVLAAVRALPHGGFLLGGTSRSEANGTKTTPNWTASAPAPYLISRPPPDFWLVRTDDTGLQLWDGVLGGTGIDFLTIAQESPDGGMILGGYSNSPADGDKTVAGVGFLGAWLVKLAPEDCDRDGVPDVVDACLGTPLGEAVDLHGCGIHQRVPCEAPWRNHGDYLRALRTVAQEFLREGRISQQHYGQLLRQAAQTDCGR